MTTDHVTALKDDAQLLLAAYMHVRGTEDAMIPEFMCPALSFDVHSVDGELVVVGVQERFDAMFSGAVRALSVVAVRAHREGVDVDLLLRDALNHLVELDETTEPSP